MNLKGKIISVVSILAFVGVTFAARGILLKQNETKVSVMKPIKTDTDARVEGWKEISASAKGLLVAKISQEGRVRFVFTNKTNYGARPSFLATSIFRFDSVDEAARFLQANPPKAALFAATVGSFIKDPGFLLVITDEEKRKLGIAEDDSPGTQIAANERKPDEIHAKKVDFPLFDWVKHGSLYWLDKLGEGAFQYRSQDGGLSILSGDIAKAQAMIRAEINDEQKTREFLRTRFPHVALYFFGKREAYIVSRSYLEQRDALPKDRWPAGVQQEEIERSAALLQRHAVDATPLKFDGEKWKLEMNVTNRVGSIERWGMDGDVFPFSIANLRQTVAEKPGSVVPLPVRTQAK